MTPRRRRREGNSLAPGGSSENSQPDIPALLIRWLTAKRCGGTLFFSVVALRSRQSPRIVPPLAYATHHSDECALLSPDDGPGALR